jgi:hypothetical protein
LDRDFALKEWVLDRIIYDLWSPEQISGFRQEPPVPRHSSMKDLLKDFKTQSVLRQLSDQTIDLLIEGWG